MVVGVLQIELSIPSANSLKAKRQVLHSLKDRIRRHFNVSVAEVGENDLWRSAVLAVVVASNDKRFANRILSKVVDFIGDSHDIVVDDYQLGII
ncbi:MAG TPA: DUF503 domain-containing protein [Verrucomicrobiae bacterium]|nr:DUF503 domain-containing protein [Verrucomicrobiae bacterium]